MKLTKLISASSLFLIPVLVMAPTARCWAGSPADAIGDYFSNWFVRASQTQAEQPHWITPLATITPLLEQELRYDQVWESHPHGASVNIYGGKGLELIPSEHVELILGIPAWLQRNRPAHTDGWADETFLLKYRLLAADEDAGNYVLTAFMGFSAPTGSEHNSKDHGIFTPTIAFGKGFGSFDMQSTVGVSFPDGGENRLGTPLAYNTAFQYRLLRIFWPEIEVNYTWWPNGERTGQNQVLITPGLVIGGIEIWQRVKLTVGAGYQVAVTQNPVSNHNVIVSARVPF